MVSLSNAHIIVSKALMSQLFNDAEKVCWVYYASRKVLLLAPLTDPDFKALHKTTTSVLKYKNNTGDRSMDVLNIILDHDLDDTNRPLQYSVDAVMKILNIQLT